MENQFNPNFSMNQVYYSGSQASIFIGDVWVDEITEIQFQTSFSASPIYGYGQQLYSHVAQGKVLVQGAFSINFKEPNYLWVILEKAKKDIRLKGEIDPLSALKPYQSETFSQTDASFEQDRRKSLDLFFNSSNPSSVAEAMQDRRSINSKTNLDYSNKTDFNTGTFDILLGYGAELDQNSPGQKILGAKIVGSGKVITHNGTPIREQYNFFARNIV